MNQEQKEQTAKQGYQQDVAAKPGEVKPPAEPDEKMIHQTAAPTPNTQKTGKP